MSYTLLLLLVHNVKKVVLVTAEQKTEPIDVGLDSQITGKAAFTQESISWPLVSFHPLH